MEIRLTQTVQNGGCAAKVSAKDLRTILAHLKHPPRDPKLLVDTSTFDDAAIYQIDSERALVQTVDFFTPIVDSPYAFGKIAACNALSDVYAMGGKPLTALAVLAFPIASLPTEVATEVLQGATDLLENAKTSLVGGHSITDETIKFGLSVTGIVPLHRIWSNQGAKVTDKLILTKPIGTGTCTAALKQSLVNEKEISQVIESMSQLNNVIDLLPEHLLSGIHAATDITGFGLTGHSQQMAKASGVHFTFETGRIPFFEQAPKFLKEGILTRAHKTNRIYTEENVDLTKLEEWQKHLVNDPQTSGGLLLSVRDSDAEAIVESIKSTFLRAQIVGTVDNKPLQGPIINFN